jgi:molybdopterin/thiamine biosynthesis adenylyltransferase
MEVELVDENEKKIEEKDVIQSQVRFSGADWYEPGMDMMVLGVGGIGSWLSLFLARQGAHLYLYDMDTIDSTNMAGQLYPKSFIGSTKVSAINRIVLDYTDATLPVIQDKYTEKSPSANIVFSCFDNMASRKIAFERWQALLKHIPKEEFAVFIDGRMLAEQGQVFCVTRDRIEDYKATLFDDSAVPDQPCTMKATSHCGAIVASYMTAVFNNCYANFKTKVDMRDTPFKIEYNLQLLMFDTYA